VCWIKPAVFWQFSSAR